MLRVSKKTRIAIFFLIMVTGLLMTYHMISNAISIFGIMKLLSAYIGASFAAIIDYKTMRIPNIIPVSLITIRIFMFLPEFFFDHNILTYLRNSLIGMLISLCFLLIVSKISRDGIGGGDIKLISAIGFLCGATVAFSTIVLSLILCSLIGGFLILTKKKSPKDKIAFGPFIAAGYAASIFLSQY